MAARRQPGLKDKGGNSNHRPDKSHSPHGEAIHHVLAGFTRRAVHHVALCGFKGQAEGERRRRRHVHPQDQHRGQRNNVPRQQGDDDQQPLRQVGRHDEEDGLLQVVIDPTALFYRAGDGGEVIIGQHHVSRLFGDFGTFDTHGDTHVGLAQRRRVVDAVSGHADHFAVILQGFHQAQLMLRAGTGKDVVLHRRLRQRRIVHVLQLVAGHGLAAVGDPQHLADAHRRLRVVASDHLHADPGGLAGMDGVNGFRTRGIHHPGDAEENQPLLQVLMVEGGGIKAGRLTGRRHHAQSLTGEARHLLFPVLRLERHRAVAAHLLAAHGEDNVRRTGDQHPGLAIDVLQGRHIFVL